MEKNIKRSAILFSLFFAGLIHSQGVGINTTNPKATLDITGNNGVTDVDGVLVPRLTRATLTVKGDSLYGTEQNGLIIYITDVMGGNASAQRINMDEPGYYIFSSAANSWQKLKQKPWQIAGETTQATINTQNIYQNGNVAIGDYSAAVPTEKLDVSGGIRIRNLEDGNLRINYPYNIVAKADGTFASTAGCYRIWRYVSTSAEAVMTDDDDILQISSMNANTITLPSNPQPGRVVLIRIDGDPSVTYNIVTPTVTPAGYLRTGYANNNNPVSASDYITRIKPRTAVELLWTGPLGGSGGGLGWVQIGGADQND